MARIGFYGGCFNPPTKAHIELAKKAKKECDLDKIIFVPIGDFYEKEKLEKGIHRYNMLVIACENHEGLEVSDIEIRSNKLYKAIDIFEILKEQHKKDEVYFLMGADNLERLPMWKNSYKLINDFNYIIFDRGLSTGQSVIESNKFFKNYKEKFRIIENDEYAKCSSTNVREQIENDEIPKDINEKVCNYIIENKLYSSLI